MTLSMAALYNLYAHMGSAQEDDQKVGYYLGRRKCGYCTARSSKLLGSVRIISLVCTGAEVLPRTEAFLYFTFILQIKVE